MITASGWRRSASVAERSSRAGRRPAWRRRGRAGSLAEVAVLEAGRGRWPLYSRTAQATPGTPRTRYRSSPAAAWTSSMNRTFVVHHPDVGLADVEDLAGGAPHDAAEDRHLLGHQQRGEGDAEDDAEVLAPVAGQHSSATQFMMALFVLAAGGLRYRPRRSRRHRRCTAASDTAVTWSASTSRSSRSNSSSPISSAATGRFCAVEQALADDAEAEQVAPRYGTSGGSISSRMPTSTSAIGRMYSRTTSRTPPSVDHLPHHELGRRRRRGRRSCERSTCG